MATYSEKTLLQKLEKLSNTAESIQVTSYWMIFHQKEAERSVQVWSQELAKTKPTRKLAFLYLANDILQNSKRKGPEFVNAFKKMLPPVISNCFKFVDVDTRKKIKRMLQVWKERSVFPVDYVEAIEQTLTDDNHVKEPKTESDIFASVYQEIAQIEQLQDSKLAATTKVNGIRSSIFEQELIDPAYIQEFEDAKTNIDNFIDILRQETNNRNRVVEMLEKVVLEHKSHIETIDTGLVEKKEILEKIKVSTPSLQVPKVDNVQATLDRIMEFEKL